MPRTKPKPSSIATQNQVTSTTGARASIRVRSKTSIPGDNDHFEPASDRPSWYGHCNVDTAKGSDPYNFINELAAFKKSWTEFQKTLESHGIYLLDKHGLPEVFPAQRSKAALEVFLEKIVETQKRQYIIIQNGGDSAEIFSDHGAWLLRIKIISGRDFQVNALAASGVTKEAQESFIRDLLSKKDSGQI